MSAQDFAGALGQMWSGIHPELLWLAVRADPRVLIWPGLFAVGAWLLVSELHAIHARPSLLDQFARDPGDENDLVFALGCCQEHGGRGGFLANLIDELPQQIGVGARCFGYDDGGSVYDFGLCQ